MNTHQNKAGKKTEMNVPANINSKELEIHLNGTQSFKSYPYTSAKRKSPCTAATNDPMPPAITNTKGQCFVEQRSFQTPQVQILVDNIIKKK